MVFSLHHFLQNDRPYTGRLAQQTDSYNVVDKEKVLNMYHGCETCYQYSMLFAGGNGIREIKTEEDFEIIKQEFVTHYNEAHKDLKKQQTIKRTFKEYIPPPIGVVSDIHMPATSIEYDRIREVQERLREMYPRHDTSIIVDEADISTEQRHRQRWKSWLNAVRDRK